jgi:glycerol-3-phosphate dehydrogenase (NAD(P)+)
MTAPPLIAVLGAGAMGAALGVHLSRTGVETVLLATDRDRAVLEAWHAGAAHPALGLFLQREIDCRPYAEWDAILSKSSMIVVAVSSAGLREVLTHATARARTDAIWVIATKGWQANSLESPAEMASVFLGGTERIVSLAGPGLAPEIAVGAPTALVCAGRNAESTQRVAGLLRGPTLTTVSTDDVTGVETASAYKNVVAVAVGICEGLTDRLVERAFVHAYANARAAVFAQGVIDMVRLAEAQGGRAETILGLAGSGDLYVTCLGGRNGRFGRLLGAGQTREQAHKVIGSTVEGITNCAAALALAARLSIDLPTAKAVAAVLTEPVTAAGIDHLAHLFDTALSTSTPVFAS